MVRRRRERAPGVPAELVGLVDEAEREVRRRADGLAEVLSGPADRAERRAAHRELRQAFDRADALLRQATGLAKQHSRGEWIRWRSRSSRLSTARQIHLFTERDDSGLLRNGSVRAVDSGMSGPDIGELQHGRSKGPGAPATYGLDLEQLLDGPPTPETRIGRRAITPPEATPTREEAA